MSQAGRFTPGVIPGTYIEEILGDVGSVSGAIISFNATPVSGSSMSFFGFGTTMLLEVTDVDANTLIGNNAGNAFITGIQNTGLGSSALAALTTGSQNVMVGVGAGDTIATGIYNIGIGFDAGSSYTTSESSNILLNSSGTVADSHTLRIGAGTGTSNGQLNRAFISGIEGITVGTADQVLVINSSNQIGSIAAGTSGQVLTSAGSGANPIWTTPSTSPVNYTSINAASSPYTVLSTDYYISADATAGPITIRLPNAPSTGRVVIVKDKVGIAATNNITITTVGGAITIDGSTSFVMNTAYEAGQVIFGGTNYEVW